MFQPHSICFLVPCLSFTPPRLFGIMLFAIPMFTPFSTRTDSIVPPLTLIITTSESVYTPEISGTFIACFHSLLLYTTLQNPLIQLLLGRFSNCPQNSIRHTFFAEWRKVSFETILYTLYVCFKLMIAKWASPPVVYFFSGEYFHLPDFSSSLKSRTI